MRKPGIPSRVLRYRVVHGPQSVGCCSVSSEREMAERSTSKFTVGWQHSVLHWLLDGRSQSLAGFSGGAWPHCCTMWAVSLLHQNQREKERNFSNNPSGDFSSLLSYSVHQKPVTRPDDAKGERSLKSVTIRKWRLLGALLGTSSFLKTRHI